MQCEKGEQIVDICCNITLAHGIIHKIRGNADRIKEGAQSGTKGLCSKTTTVLSIPKAVNVSLIQFYCIRSK
jgi:hypothetical protein